jgi:hypothetical protein
MSPQLAGEFSTLMAGISDDDPDVREREAKAAKQSIPGFAVRDIRRLNTACDRQSKRINEDVSLASLYPFVPVKPARSAALRRLHRLPIHDDDRRALAATRSQPDSPMQHLLQPGPHTLSSPNTETMIDGAPWWILARQKSPLAACAQQVKDRVDDSTKIGGTRPPTGQSCRELRLDDRPRRVVQVSVI